MTPPPSQAVASAPGVAVGNDAADVTGWAPEYRALAREMQRDLPAPLSGAFVAPSVLELHTGRFCPAGCSFCPTSGPKLYAAGRRRSPLRHGELALLIKDFARLSGRLLVLSGGLEPLTGPALAAARLAREQGLRVHLYTSGLAPSLDRSEVRAQLLNSVDRVRFSVNAFRRQTYRSVQSPGHGGGRQDLDAVVCRIRCLLAERPRNGPRTSIGISFVAIPANHRELSAAAGYWSRAGADFFDALIDIDCDHPAGIEVERALHQLRQRARRGGLAPLRVRVSGRAHGAPPLGLPCAAPRAKVAVDPYGRVWRCCHVANPERGRPGLCLGDLREDSIESILRSECAAPQSTGCRTCPDWERTFNALYQLERRHAARSPAGPPSDPRATSPPSRRAGLAESGEKRKPA